MAANQFATMLQKNCHKITVILFYAVLEWILILLLLLNSLFSYLIAKFALFFGLKPSCTWCSRLEHHASNNSYLDHVCEAHGTQISNMSYCFTHNNLADSKNLCTHCSTSRPSTDVSSTFAFFTWMSGQSVSEGVEEGRCSCCHQILNRALYPPQSMVFKNSLDVILEYLNKNKMEFEADLVGEKTNDGPREFDVRKKAEIVEECVSHDSNLEVQEWSSSQTTDDPFGNLGCNEDDESVYIADMLLQNAELMDSDRFICIELIDRDAREIPLTNSSQHVEEGRVHTKLDVLDVDALENPSSIKSLAGPSREIDGADAEGVEEAENLSELGHKDWNLDELDNCVEAILAGSSETDSFSSRGATSEIEGGVESLKTRIQAQEKALNALYAELEEERRAAADAAMETMAMITKLQEEKAAMQMEAAQYQRMMEEQAEYDQEALQLLNDLMLKREKEKKELEKELEIYRGNAKIRRSYSTDDASEEDTRSADLHLDGDDDDSHNVDETGAECSNNSIMAGVSLAEFDEERACILEELKVLEAKVLALHDEDALAKKLLPLLDAEETDECYKDGKILIQEELGPVYERLQALEADKDFLKHCIRSMMKGNEPQGMGLLQEILQHLRDLKSVELLARNMDGVPLSQD